LADGHFIFVFDSKVRIVGHLKMRPSLPQYGSYEYPETIWHEMVYCACQKLKTGLMPNINLFSGKLDGSGWCAAL
jgi:hypothetical protein